MGFLSSWTFTAAGYGAAGVLLWLYIDAKGDVKAEIERCNTEKMAAVAETEQIVRVAVQEGMQAEIDRLIEQNERADRAREIAEEAARLAEARIPEVREVIREVANENACIDTAIPAAIIDSLR